MADRTKDLAWAVAELSGGCKRLQAYRKYEKYYDGDHPLAFATKKFRSTFWAVFNKFAENLCQSVVDIQAERLEVIGFTSSDAGTKETAGGVRVVDDPIGSSAWDLWEEQDLDLVADEVHQDALLYGDGFTITETDGSVWVQEPCQMAVRYSEEYPGKIEVAAKIWKNQDGTYNLNLYYDDELVEYVTERKPDSGTALTADMFTEASREDLAGQPVSHFPNRAYSRYGRSELAAVLPIQDALNKSLIDTLVSMEYQAFRQRWITGTEVELDDNGRPKNFQANHGPGEFLALPDENAKVGEFGQADLAPLVQISDGFRAAVARTSGIPLHYMFVSPGGGSPTGESLKTSEVRFTRKARRQQKLFGKSWELTVRYALRATGDEDVPASVDLNVVWEPTSPRSESEELDVLVKKQALGVPNSQLQKEAGYDADQIEQFASEAPPEEHAKTTVEDIPGPAAPDSAVPQHSGADPAPTP